MVKTSIGVSILGLAAAGGIVWLGSHRSFCSVDVVEHTRAAKNRHSNRPIVGKSRTNDALFVASAFEVEKHVFGHVAGPLPEHVGKSMDDLLALDANQLKRVMARAGRLQDGPEGQVMRRFLVAALVRLAKRDPNAALDWFQENFGRFPKLIDSDSKESLISTVAQDDPGLAFRMIEGDGFKDLQANPIGLIASTATTSDSRSTTLAALRDHIATLPEEGSDREMASRVAIYNLIKTAVREGFEPAT